MLYKQTKLGMIDDNGGSYIIRWRNTELLEKGKAVISDLEDQVREEVPRFHTISLMNPVPTQEPSGLPKIILGIDKLD